MRRSGLVLSMMTAVSTAGCGYGYGYGDGFGCIHPGWGHQPSVVRDAPAAHDDEQAIARAEEAPTYTPTEAPHMQPRRTAPDPEHARFDVIAATRAIHDVDLAPCVQAGAPRGYGHALTTFGSDGAPARVVLDAPAGLGPDAVRCLSERLGTATVAAFEGAPTTVGASFYVR